MLKTSVIDNDLNPVWNESYRIEVCHFAEHLKFTVADKDHAYSEYIGTVEIPTASLATENIIQGWFPICKGNGVPHGKAELKVQVQFISRYEMEKTYHVNCYFATKSNNFSNTSVQYTTRRCPCAVLYRESISGIFPSIFTLSGIGTVAMADSH